MCDSSANRRWACSNLAVLSVKESGTKRCAEARRYRLVPLHKARCGPFASVCTNWSMGRPRGRVLHTGYNGKQKDCATAPIFSASDAKHSKDLHARPDQLHPDPRAAQREAVELIPRLTNSRIGMNRGYWGRPRFLTSSGARGRRNERVTYSPPSSYNQRNFGTAQSFGEQRSARASK